MLSIGIEDDRDHLTDSRRILVVEDDPRFAAILRDLARARLQCRHAPGQRRLAAAALYRPRRHPPDMNPLGSPGLGVLVSSSAIPTRHIGARTWWPTTQEALERGAIGYASPVKRESWSRPSAS